jgi:hypothetical protein
VRSALDADRSASQEDPPDRDTGNRALKISRAAAGQASLSAGRAAVAETSPSIGLARIEIAVDPSLQRTSAGALQTEQVTLLEALQAA